MSEDGGCAQLLSALQRRGALPGGVIPRGCVDRRSRCALSIAAGAGATPEVLSRLEEAGYDVNSADVDGLSPLSYAARLGKPLSARFLLAQGADASRYDVYGVAPVHKASAFGQARVLAEMLANNNLASLPMGTTDRAPAVYQAVSKQELPLHLVARSGWATTSAQREETMLVLLANTASADSRDAEGDTPLHAAAECGETALCRLLLKNSCNPRPLDSRGKTPAERVTWTENPLLKAELNLRAFFSTSNRR